MNREIVVAANNISKIYKLYKSPKDRFIESISMNKIVKHKDFYALKNMNFEILKGETVGFIGKNGAGKSTILKILSGILTPTTGEIEISGKVSALLELGAGFNPEFSGLENVFLYGTMLGMKKEQMEEKLDEILGFADIGDFIYQPVKSYSSGMFVRLAFACAVNVNADILIVDEALSVGDIRFQQKCYRKITEFKEKGTVIFVSHDLGAIKNFCDRVLWINDGQIYKEGAPDQILDEYHAFMTYDATFVQMDNSETNATEIKSNFSSKSEMFGEGAAQIFYAELRNEKSNLGVIESGEKVDLLIHINVLQNINFPLVGFVLKDRLGNSILIVNNELEGLTLKSFEAGDNIIVKYSFTFPLLKEGTYSIDLAVAEGTYNEHIQHHWISDALLIDVKTQKKYPSSQGFVVLNNIGVNIVKHGG